MSTKQKPQSILLIEDDVTLSDAFFTLLDCEGFEVFTAFNGEEALEHLETVAPDLILLDILMPIMDGKEFLKKFDNPNNVPIIVFSNLDTKTDINEVLKLGASRYILKSWATPEELIQVIKEEINDLSS